MSRVQQKVAVVMTIFIFFPGVEVGGVERKNSQAHFLLAVQEDIWGAGVAGSCDRTHWRLRSMGNYYIYRSLFNITLSYKQFEMYKAEHLLKVIPQGNIKC